MRGARIAELLLELFTDRANATGTVGDLLELAGGRTSVRFWLQIAQTASSHLWSDLSAEPLFLLKLSVHAAFARYLLMVAFLLAGIFLVIPLVLLANLLPAAPFPAAGLGRMFGLIDVLTAFYVTGIWVGRHSHGRTIAACLACLAMLEIGIPLVVGYSVSASGLTPRLTDWVNAHASAAPQASDLGIPPFLLLPAGYGLMMIAALRVRRKSQRASV